MSTFQLNSGLQSQLKQSEANTSNMSSILDLKKTDSTAGQRKKQFKPILEDQLSIPSQRQKLKSIVVHPSKGLRSKFSVITSNAGSIRKYETKIKESDTIVTSNFDRLISEDQYENVKTLGDKIDDIFDHTDGKVTETMSKITNVYNRKRNINADVYQDIDIHNTLKNNIAYPKGYDVPVMNFADFIIGKLNEKSL